MTPEMARRVSERVERIRKELDGSDESPATGSQPASFKCQWEKAGNPRCKQWCGVVHWHCHP